MIRLPRQTPTNRAACRRKDRHTTSLHFTFITAYQHTSPYDPVYEAGYTTAALGGFRVDVTRRTRSPSAARERYPTLGRSRPPPLFRGAWLLSRPRDAAAPPARGGPCLAVSQEDALAPAGLVRRPPPPPGLVGRASCCELALFFSTGRRRLADRFPCSSALLSILERRPPARDGCDAMASNQKSRGSGKAHPLRMPPRDRYHPRR